MLIPGGNTTALSTLIASGGNELGLCNATVQDHLVGMLCHDYTVHGELKECHATLQMTAYNAQLAVFNLVVDRLQVLRLPYTDIIFPLVNATTNGLSPTLVAIVFR